MNTFPYSVKKFAICHSRLYLPSQNSDVIFKNLSSCKMCNAASSAGMYAAPRPFQAAPCLKEIGTKNSPFSSFLSIIIIIIKMIVRCLILAGGIEQYLGRSGNSIIFKRKTIQLSAPTKIAYTFHEKVCD